MKHGHAKPVPVPPHQERLPFTFKLSPIQTCKLGFMLGFPKFEWGFGGEEERYALGIVDSTYTKILFYTFVTLFMFYFSH